jgi:glycosyltransferase involved in cell wall biosynthesis
LNVSIVAEWYDKVSLYSYKKIFRNKPWPINLISIALEYLNMNVFDYILFTSEDYLSILNKRILKKNSYMKILPSVDSELFRPYAKEKARVLFNNLINDKIFDPNNKYILLYIGGNFDYYFQIKDVILITKIIEKISKNIITIIKVPYKFPGLEKFKKYSSNNLIFFDKFIERDKLPLFLSSFDLAIYITDENIVNEHYRFPYRMLECLACGIPIFTVGNVGELARTINKYKCGLVIEKVDYHEIAKEIVNLINNNEILNKYSMNAREFANRASMENNAKILDVFLKMLTRIKSYYLKNAN